MKNLFVITFVGLAAANAYAYRLNDVAQKGARWNSLPINMKINEENADLPNGEAARVIQKAMSNWNDKVGKSIFSSEVNASLSSSQTMESDGENAIAFSKNFRLDSNGFDPDVVVAVGGQYGDGTSMSDAFVLFNSEAVAWTTDQYKKRTGMYTDDLETVATHELGHVIGLGHSEVSTAVMSTERVESVMTELGQDDVDGAKYLLSSSTQGAGKSGNSAGCGYIANAGSGGGFGGGNQASMMMMLFPMLALLVARLRKAYSNNLVLFKQLYGFLLTHIQGT